MHKDKAMILKCKKAIETWLTDIGLELKPEKTRITHTLEPELSEDKTAGFDFLGFHIQQHKSGKHKCSKNQCKQLTGYITLITPTLKSQKKHQEKLGEAIRSHRSQPIDILIYKLNPIIRGWINYYKYSDIKTVGISSKMTNLVFSKMRSWAKLSCKSVSKGLARYYHYREYTMLDGNKSHRKEWADSQSVKLSLIQHGDIETTKKGYVKVKGNRSPFDGDTVYWGKRLQSHPELSTRELRLLKTQKGKCAWCGLHFNEGDNWEIDHIIPKSQGGKDIYDNLQLLHSHCHDSKTATDGSLDKKQDYKSTNYYRKGNNKNLTEGEKEFREYLKNLDPKSKNGSIIEFVDSFGKRHKVDYR